MLDIFGVKMQVQVASPGVIALLVGASVFLLIVLIAVLRDEKENKKSRNPRSENEWLFSRWDEKLYDTLFKSPPEKTLKSLGVDILEYQKNCRIIKRNEIDYKKLASGKIAGIFVMLFSLPLLFMSSILGLLVAILLIGIGYYMYMGDANHVAKLAKEKKQQISAELPRFLDLLQTALYIDMPISEAITITAQKLKNTCIAKELLESMVEIQVGSSSWQKALQDMAILYEVDEFSDFVQYLINGYEKGLSIYDVVVRLADDTREAALIRAEEIANKTNTSILVPVALFKLFPIIIIIAIPFVRQLLAANIIF